MLFIFSALYPEVQALIQRRGLKRRQNSGRFQQFIGENEKLLLTITGAGEVPAAASVAAVLSHENAGRGDLLLSLGSCCYLGEKREEIELGSYVCLNAIKNRNSGRRFYPDLQEKGDFPEGSCLSGSQIIEREEQRTEIRAQGYSFYDMEAAAVYEAGNFFLGPDQLRFLRLVSDFGEGSSVSPDQLRTYAERSVEKLSREVDKLLTLPEILFPEEPLLRETEESYVDKLCTELKLSKTLADRFRQQIRYLSLSELPWREVTEEWSREGLLPVRDKRNGQKRMEELWNHFHTSM